MYIAVCSIANNQHLPGLQILKLRELLIKYTVPFELIGVLTHPLRMFGVRLFWREAKKLAARPFIIDLY